MTHTHDNTEPQEVAIDCEFVEETSIAPYAAIQKVEDVQEIDEDIVDVISDEEAKLRATLERLDFDTLSRLVAMGVAAVADQEKALDAAIKKCGAYQGEEWTNQQKDAKARLNAVEAAYKEAKRHVESGQGRLFVGVDAT